MAIEIIPRPVKKIPPWQNILFYFSVALLLVSVSSYFGLNYFLEKSERELKDLEETLAEEKISEEIALEERVFNYQKKIRDFSTLIDRHFYPSKLFDFFQGLCHPKVWFSKFNLNFKEYALVVSGQAENFSVLGQQLLIFRQEDRILEVNLPKINIGKQGKVDFTFNFSLDPKIFK